ncbi:MAG TPA: hypothetical protein VMG12_08385 [Polyangiaceae bacterium]|nr:hypothetical protein [Polyangiaceae bacterium]
MLGASALLALACPQLLDDSFDAAGDEGGAASGATGGASAAGSGGASGIGGRAGSNSAGSSGSGSGVSGSGGSGAGGGAGGAAGSSGSGGSNAAGSAGNGGSAGATGATSCSDFSAPELIAGLGRVDALYGPGLAGDGLVLAFSESTDEAPEDIFFSVRPTRTGAFGIATPATGINTADAEGTAFLTRDALTLYFFSDRPGGPGGRDIYRATRATTGADFADIHLVEGINGDTDDHMPWLSPDELTLYFVSNRAADEGGTNLWVARRSGPNDGFEPPAEVPGMNSGGRDVSPALTSDQRILVFCSDRAGGAGSDDIWMATRSSTANDFGAPVPLPVVNGATSELNVTISDDGRELIFSSNLDGSRKLYRSVRTCP